jgi:hypothetical protein
VQQGGRGEGAEHRRPAQRLPAAREGRMGLARSLAVGQQCQRGGDLEDTDMAPPRVSHVKIFLKSKD